MLYNSLLNAVDLCHASFCGGYKFIFVGNLDIWVIIMFSITNIWLGVYIYQKAMPLYGSNGELQGEESGSQGEGVVTGK